MVTHQNLSIYLSINVSKHFVRQQFLNKRFPSCLITKLNYEFNCLVLYEEHREKLNTHINFIKS